MCWTGDQTTLSHRGARLCKGTWRPQVSQETPHFPTSCKWSEQDMDTTDLRGEEDARGVRTCGARSCVLCSVCYRKEGLRVGGLRAPHSHNVETINHGQPWRATCDFWMWKALLPLWNNLQLCPPTLSSFLGRVSQPRAATGSMRQLVNLSGLILPGLCGFTPNSMHTLFPDHYTTRASPNSHHDSGHARTVTSFSTPALLHRLRQASLALAGSCCLTSPWHFLPYSLFHISLSSQDFPVRTSESPFCPGLRTEQGGEEDGKGHWSHNG